MSAAQLVLVEWVDSGRGDGWFNMDDAIRDAADDPMRCESVGWLLADEETYVLVAPSQKLPHRPGAAEVLSPLQIPRCAITGIRPLTAGRKRR